VKPLEANSICEKKNNFIERKSQPKLEPPFTCYLYCGKAKTKKDIVSFCYYTKVILFFLIILLMVEFLANLPAITSKKKKIVREMINQYIFGILAT
jgi:hypothetical protein